MVLAVARVDMAESVIDQLRLAARTQDLGELAREVWEILSVEQREKYPHIGKLGQVDNERRQSA
jgi:hypothetical protein